MKKRGTIAFLAGCVFAFLTLVTPLQAQGRLPRFQHDELYILLIEESYIPHLKKWNRPDRVYTITSEEEREYHVYEYSDKTNNPKILQKFKSVRLYFGVDPEYNWEGRDYWRLLAIEFVKPPMPEGYITQYADKYLGETSRFKKFRSRFYSVWYIEDEQILLLERKGKKIKRIWVLWHTAVDLIQGEKTRKSINNLYNNRGE